MARPVDEEKERMHVMIFGSDMDELRKRYGATIGVGVAIRNIVRIYLKGSREQLEEELAKWEASNAKSD